MTLNASTFYSFDAFAECGDFAEHEAAGNTTDVIKASIRRTFEGAGFQLAEDPRIDVTRNVMTADVLCAVMQLTTPPSAVNEGDVDLLFIGACNANAANGNPAIPARRLFTRHVPGVWSALAAVMPSRADHPIGSVVTTTLSTRPTTRRPSASASVLGQATSQFNHTASTDPARDGNLRIANNGGDALDLGVGTKLAIAGAVGLVGAVLVAYVIRSVK